MCYASLTFEVAAVLFVSRSLHDKITSIQLVASKYKYLEIMYTATHVIRGLAFMHNVWNIVHL